MLKLSAIFSSKESAIKAQECIVAKVIRLPGAAFDSFSRNLLRDHDFIIDSNRLVVGSEDGKRRCLLVVGEGRRDGILVDSQGYDYARHSAVVPNVEAALTAGRYSALGELNKKLSTMVDTISEQAGAADPRGRGTVDLNVWGEMLGIDLNNGNTLRSTVLAMLDERPEIMDWQLDGSQLTVQRDLGLSDPETTRTDMYAYGYTWDGMIPLGKERALELFDAGHEVFRLNESDSEGLADDREDIENFDGLFGVEDPTWERSKAERIQPFQAFIVNNEKDSDGKAVGEWLTLPADADTMQGLLERIGVEKPTAAAFLAGDIDGPTHAAFTVTALRTPIEDYLRDYVSKYDRLDELNMLASFVDDMEDYQLDKLQAILQTGIADLSKGSYTGRSDIAAIINLLYDDNFTAFEFIYAHNEDELGRWYVDAGEDEIPEAGSFEELGRICAREEGGRFVKDLDGYVKHKHKVVALEYDGKVLDEHKIVGTALRGLFSKKPELAAGEKPSVLDEIKASRESKARAASKSKDWDVQKTKKNKGGQDL